MKRTSYAFSSLRLGLVLVALTLSGSAWAAPNWLGRLNYQGQLTDSAGNAVADSSYEVTFRVWNADSGGNLVWSEVQNVLTSKGLFNAVLGTFTPVDFGIYSIDDLYMELQVTGDSVMTPRQQLLPAVYAFNAAKLDGNVVGTSPFNIVQLNGLGKIPPGLVNGGSVSVPLDLAGSALNNILRVHNSSSGVAVSATTASTTQAAVFAESKYGAVIKTTDSVNGIALQATGPGSAYASLIDRVNNAQVYGLANASGTLAVLGVNSNVSGIGVAGSGGSIGVSGTGNTYGVYGRSDGNIGVYGTGIYGVHGYTTFNNATARGVFGQYSGAAAATGVWGENSSTAAGARGVYGVHTAASGAGYGVQGHTNANTTNATGIYGTASGASAQVYGVRGEVSSSSMNSAGVYGRSTGSFSKGVYGEATGSNGRAIEGNATAVGGYGVLAWGYNGTGVAGVGATGVMGETYSSGGAAVRGYSESSASPAIWGQNYEGGPVILADGYETGVSATAAITGVYGEANGTTGIAGRFLASSTTGVNTALSARTESNSGFAGRFSGGSRALVAEGSGIAVSATSSGQYAGYFHSNSWDAMRVVSDSGWGMNVYSAAGGIGVYAEAGGNYGTSLYGANYGTGGTGVYGYTSGANAYSLYGYAGGSSSYAVYGQANSTNSWGVYGTASGTGSHGVYGSATGSTGYGVLGNSATSGAAGVRGQSSVSGGRGVEGVMTSTGTTGYGGYFTHAGTSTSAYGVRIDSTGSGLYLDVDDYGISFDQTGSPEYGIRWYNVGTNVGNAPVAIYAVNYCYDCIAGIFSNTSATAAMAGYALLAEGQVRMPSMVNRESMSSVTSKVVSNSYVDSTAVITLTPDRDIGYGNRYWVESIADGTFTMRIATAVSGLIMHYHVMNE